MSIVPEIREIPVPDLSALKNLVWSENSLEGSGRLDIHIFNSANLPRENSDSSKNLITKLIKRRNLVEKAGKESIYVSDDDYIVLLQNVGNFDIQSSEVYYANGNKAGHILYNEDPTSLNIYFHIEITEDELTAYVNRLFFHLVSSALYKTTKDEIRKLKSVYVSAEKMTFEHISAALNTARVLALSSLHCANLINSPPNYCNCITFASYMESQAKLRSSITIEILNTTDLAKLKMFSFLSVAQGSKYGARLVHLTYRNGKPERKIALVGKGITMDSGGYNLKPGSSIYYMKYDMAGAATVCSSLLAIADLGIMNVEVHAVAVLCENMIGKDAYRTGDVITASNQKTIEVHNTDAEGRLALADGLIYAEKLLGGPGEGTIIDIATLTGACVVALGEEIAALFSNSIKLMKNLEKSSAMAGESVWPMPLRKSYLDHLKSDIADIKNVKVGSASAGTITAALFLQEFVDKKTEWAHIDIAGVGAQTDSKLANAWGISTLVNFVARH